MVAKNVRVVQYVYESSVTVGSSAVGVMNALEMEVGLHQGSALYLQW